MVLLFNLLKFHKNGGDGDEVLGFWFHTNYLRKFSNTIEDLEIPHLSISCPEWLAEDDLTSFCRPFQRSPSPTRRAWKRWATRRKVRPKRLDPLASAMEVSAGKIIENVGSASHVWLRVGMGRGFLRFDQHLMRSLFFVKMEDLASFFSFPIAFKWEDLEGRSWVVSFSATSAPAKWKTWGFQWKNMGFSNGKTLGFPRNWGTTKPAKPVGFLLKPLQPGPGLIHLPRLSGEGPGSPMEKGTMGANFFLSFSVFR